MELHIKNYRNVPLKPSIAQGATGWQYWEVRKALYMIGCLAVLAGCTPVESNEGISGVVNTLPASQEHLAGSPVIQCEFDSYTQVEPMKNDGGAVEVGYKVFTEDNPLHLKFVIDDNDSKAKLIGNNGESDLIVSRNDNNGIVLIERNMFGNVFTYNIFLDQGFGIWTKTNDIFGSVYSFISVGRCW